MADSFLQQKPSYITITRFLLILYPDCGNQVSHFHDIYEMWLRQKANNNQATYVQADTLSVFSTLSIAPSGSPSLFFSGWPCAVSAAYVLHDDHTWVQWEVVKPTCTLPCFDLPALNAGPGGCWDSAINAHYECACASPWSPCSHRSISLAQGNGAAYEPRDNTHTTQSGCSRIQTALGRFYANALILYTHLE